VESRHDQHQPEQHQYEQSQYRQPQYQLCQTLQFHYGQSGVQWDHINRRRDNISPRLSQSLIQKAPHTQRSVVVHDHDQRRPENLSPPASPYTSIRDDTPGSINASPLERRSSTLPPVSREPSPVLRDALQTQVPNPSYFPLKEFDNSAEDDNFNPALGEDSTSIASRHRSWSWSLLMFLPRLPQPPSRNHRAHTAYPEPGSPPTYPGQKP
jgi:hypothetical protein